MKRIYLYFISCIMVVTGLCTSCDAQLEQMNPNKATEDTFWQTEADFELALTSCYTPLKNALNGGYYGTRGVMMRIARADEVDLETISAMSFKPVILQIQMEILFHKGCFINSIMHCIERIQSCRSWKRSKENSERISSIR